MVGGLGDLGQLFVIDDAIGFFLLGQIAHGLAELAGNVLAEITANDIVPPLLEGSETGIDAVDAVFVLAFRRSRVRDALFQLIDLLARLRARRTRLGRAPFSGDWFAGPGTAGTVASGALTLWAGRLRAFRFAVAPVLGPVARGVRAAGFRGGLAPVAGAGGGSITGLRARFAPGVGSIVCHVSYSLAEKSNSISGFGMGPMRKIQRGSS